MCSSGCLARGSSARSIAFIFNGFFLGILLHPLKTVLHNSHSIIPGDQAIITSPTEGITVPLKVAAVVGLVIALPIVLWQVWSFVSPGLRPKERKFVGPFIASALLLFAVGAVFAYFVMPLGLNFLTNFLSGNAVYFPDIDSYIGFFLIIIFVFGITFEMPVALVLLGILGLVSSKKLKGWRKPAYVGIILVALVITPGADPVHAHRPGDPAAAPLRGVDHRAPADLPPLRFRSRPGQPIHSGAMRPDQRSLGELRPTTIELHTLPYAEGSALITMGETRVLCAASVEERVPPFRKGTGKGWVTAEYAMLPRSTQTRTERDGRKGRVDGRVQEIQRLIGRSLRAAVDFDALGERSILIDCDVMVADGGTRTASITGGYVALALAVARLRQARVLRGDPLRWPVAAVSAGIVSGEARLDLCYLEDSAAETDMNCVGSSDGRFIELQGSAEQEPFSREELDALLGLAGAGLRQLFAIQAEVLASAA